MTVGKAGRILAALILAGLLASGCTPAAPTPPPTPPSVSQTPTETAIERQQRLDYEAAEKSYRAFRAEYGRVLRAGGAKKATSKMKALAGGDYLKQFVEVIQAYHGFGYHDEGEEKNSQVSYGGYSKNSVILNVCEDDRAVKALDKAGKSLGPGELRRSRLEVRKIDEEWKVWSGSGDKVNSCG